MARRDQEPRAGMSGPDPLESAKNYFLLRFVCARGHNQGLRAAEVEAFAKFAGPSLVDGSLRTVKLLIARNLKAIFPDTEFADSIGVFLRLHCRQGEIVQNSP